MRDDKWLFQKLDEVWDTFFPDVPQDNDVQIVWGRKARTRLGSIRQAKPDEISNVKFPILNQTQNPKFQPTIITINSLFKDEFIPEYVITATIAHELAHYAHGFNSPLARKYAKPHEGGVVHKELDDRGAKKLEKMQKKWLKENWREYTAKHFDTTKRRAIKKKRRIIIKWI